MPKHTRATNSSQNHYGNSMPVSLAPAANPIAMYNQRMAMPQSAYYTMPSSSTSMQPQPQPTYESYAPVSAPPSPYLQCNTEPPRGLGLPRMINSCSRLARKA
ncbi:MYB family transcription factor [Colletotrichum tofieldiae]|nr:MYB family transcription factor [Colletotrichum tofieldiae]